MTDTIGVRELKNRASSLLRSVREEMRAYVITLHGEPIAILRPLDAEELQNLKQAETSENIDQMKALALRVAAAWTSPLSGVELVAEQRR
ncbi:MAG: type II toxin-antitoxin system Phd/YefM family antitoxin [Anaerolineales bacterium]|nr:type II toxin-antitoxin system Phd/YefM family antitoxin [Anaerolineales bacterium]